jgi:enoyl reductase
MIRRIALAAGITAAGFLASLSATVPASAGSGPASGSSSGGSCVGSACSVGIEQFITYKGSPGAVAQSGTGHAPIDVQPPPCQWIPVGDATTGSQYVIQNSVDSPVFQQDQTLKQAKDLLQNPAPGQWYYLPINPAAGAAGAQACLQLPLYAWVPPGQVPPMPPVPGKTLAQFAFNHLRVPKPQLTTNPVGKGFVNLGTYVWLTRGGGSNPRTITAALGNQSATLTATPSKLRISANGPGTIGNNCGATGSAAPVGQPPASAGAGTVPDCGVLWRAPTGAATITATVVWRISWTATDGTGGRLQAIRRSGTAGPFPVREIQSVNGN